MNTIPVPSQSVPLEARDYVTGVLAGSRTMLGRAITLIESNAPRHAPIAEEVVREILPHSGKSIRVGITGVPGVGKSTFIEALGCLLCERGRRVAVLAVDPSSTRSHGSILGDKTRMERLSRHPNCFIRPSPSGGTLGGVARKSRETFALCEAAGYDVVLVETVGVGQSETTVRSMVDFFLVLLLAGAGDELQGIKKGIVEMADALVVTKADGPNTARTEATRVDFSRVLHFLSSPTPGWRPEVHVCSSVEGTGIAETWDIVERFQRNALENGSFHEHRRSQALDWMRDLLQQELWSAFMRNPSTVARWPAVEHSVVDGTLSPVAAVRHLLQTDSTHTSHDPKN